MRRIVAYTFLNVCEKKSTSFCQALKDAHKRKLVPVFSASQCIYDVHSTRLSDRWCYLIICLEIK